MRVTLDPGPGLPGTELEIAAGATLGELRERIAAVAACPAALSAPVVVAGLELDDAHRAGTFPVLAGARLSLGAAPEDETFAAVRAPRHLAVVAGPDAGRIQALDNRLEVGRAGGAVATPAESSRERLGLADPLVSRAHLELRAGRRRVRVRDLGSANGARLELRRGSLPVPRWPIPWRVGQRVVLGSSLLELRTAPRPEARRARAPRSSTLLLASTALAPALGSIALAAGTRNPALLALGLAGPALAGVLAQRPAPAEEPELAAGSEEPGGPSPLELDASLLTAQLARAVLSGAPPPEEDSLARLAPGGFLAVTGPGAREAAATLVLAARPSALEVLGPRSGRWSWGTWLEGGGGPQLVVVDGAEGRPELGGAGRVVVLVDPERVPSWCTARLEAASGVWEGPEGRREVRVLAGSARWAEEQARLIASWRCVEALGSAGLPDSVTLGALGLPASAAEISRTWEQADGGLRAVIGSAGDGRTATVDLAREGPHVLVAGTTGSGKSELLRALVASLALRYPPTALAFALVDFKGGAGFGALAGLPHVVGTVTDLDPLDAARALAGLAAELRARKALLARVGLADLRDWPAGEPGHPGRLVVVIDEFRALAEELPELMGALERIATQGRSLGVHLVLATQRPSGVVSSELRANVALRLALRVTDASDSSDVLEVPDAAAIPPSLPGRALLRRGPGPVEELQVAQLGAGAPLVRLAGSEPTPGPAGEDAPLDLVEAVREASAGWAPGAPRPRAPWLGALPEAVPLESLAGPEDPGLLPFGLADLPARQSRETAVWDPAAGHLLVLGGPGAGRSTTLATLGSAALERGWSVHAVDLPAGLWPDAREAPGTVCASGDPRRLARLVTLLREAPGRSLLLVDDLAQAWLALESVARGAGAERLAELLRSRSVALAAGASRPSGAWAGLVTERLVLPVGDAVAEELAGVPRALSGARRGPGRAVWVPAREDPVICQVALPPAAPPQQPPGPGPRLAPIPLLAERPPSAQPRRRGLPVGLGGDGARTVTLPAQGGALVVGPPGSGRSTALAHLVRGLALSTTPTTTIARDPGVLELARAAGPSSDFEAESVLALLEAAPSTLVVDDLDQLTRLVPQAGDTLDALVESGSAVLASASLDAVLGAYRGTLASLRSRRTGLVLSPLSPGSGEVFGTPLDWDADPVHPRHPGRGVVQAGARTTPVQVFAPG